MMMHDLNSERGRTSKKMWILLIAVIFISSCSTYGDEKNIFPYPDSREKLSSEFELLSWNVAKGNKSDTPMGISGILNGLLEEYHPEIICLQEYVPEIGRGTGMGGHFGRSFKWWFKNHATGVATFSRVPPVYTKAMLAPLKEGLFITPKCALVTRYPINCSKNPDEELLLINLHALNFQVSTWMLKKQMEQVVGIVGPYRGPVIVCGDFNTWRRDRLAVVKKKLEGFREVAFDRGRSGGGAVVKLVMGDPQLPLDRVFYRGLEVQKNGKIINSNASDHKPIFVGFSCHPHGL